jgi:RpiR family carbohydrate utilization transcriptional regulator
MRIGQVSSKAALARTRSLQSSLTPSEAAVAEVVLGRRGQVVRMSIHALARQAGVSTTTVLRFCESVGFRSFTDLKIALAIEMAHMPTMLPGEVQADDTPIQIAHKVLYADMQAITQTLDLLDENAFTRAVEALGSANRIEVYGVGSSGPIAIDAYYRFLRIGLRVAVVTDSHMQVVSSALLSSGDVALVISHTGRTKETLDTAGEARKSGATVVALTSYLGTPIEDVADIVLVTATAESTFRTEAMSSRIAHLSVIDALYVALANQRLGRAVATLDRTGRLIERKRV